ncbi:MAG: phenylacetate-CoA oxygenase subunit PaaJ [Pseudomonadota bacterium]|nr:phenylacetate-CoA oxygenase subunit PaaJ [Pseudomonadota bacterium]
MLACAGDDANAGGRRPTWAAIWSALARVPDPEIPVVSVLELGIVRAVEWDPIDTGALVVRVTPTYTGCPATQVILQTIEAALRQAGVTALRIDTVLAPAWSAAWLAPGAARKLREYGIAPPHSAIPGMVTVDTSGLGPLRRARATVPCPRCGSPRTQLVTQFGSTACKAQYRCVDCLEPFDFFKPL